MKNKNNGIILGILILNIVLRCIYIVYGYISSEEGMLIYGQKLAYSGLIPFIDYNAWNSLLNNYLVGWYHFLIAPTIITQRIFALIVSAMVFFLVLYIGKNLKKQLTLPLSAFLMTFGSLTYLYYSTIPTSEQMMTLSLVISLAILSKTLVTKKHELFMHTLAFVFALIAFPIRPQAAPATIIIWLYCAIQYRTKLKSLFIITSLGITSLFIIYLPFVTRSWDNFVYSFIWPFKAHEILVYQAGIANFNFRSLIPYSINVFKEYNVLFIILGAALCWKLKSYKTTLQEIYHDRIYRFVFFSLLSAASVAGLSLIHKPPYSTYIYPAVPLFSYVAAFYVAALFENTKVIGQEVRVFFCAILLLLTIQSLSTFPHTDYMKTSLATITQPPYVLLQEIHRHIESKTTSGGEVLSFYLPAAAELKRIIPKDINEGEGSISILPREEAYKYHLTTVEMLKEYFASQKAEAVILVSITPRFWGVTQNEREETMKTLERYYYLDKEFDNFFMIGNPRVKTLSVYLRRS